MVIKAVIRNQAVRRGRDHERNYHGKRCQPVKSLLQVGCGIYAAS